MPLRILVTGFEPFKVEVFQAPKTKDGSTTAEGALKNLPASSKLSLKATKLFTS